MKEFKMLINALDKVGHINKEIYGNFSEHLGRCIYEGLYVGEDSPIENICGIRKDVIDAMKQIQVPVLRWPGGCFADEYHWMDGIGPKEKRKRMVNTNWGGVVEDNSFGTHEFMKLCELTGCEPYITGNVGSGTVKEMAEWIEYMTFDGVSPMAELRRQNGQDKPWKLKYFAVGNESWGCGGNMSPERYSEEYRKFASFCKNYSGNQLYRVACGPSSSDYNWTEVMMKNLKSPGYWMAEGLALHFYSIPDWNAKGYATEFGEEEYYKLLSCANFTGPLIEAHSKIMDRYDPENHVGLIVDEWGTWFEVEKGTNPGFLYQQNTMRDAMVAAISLNAFNRHCRRVKMANIAQMVNVLQAIILTEGENLVKTPTYHVFDLFKGHMEGEAVYCFSENVNMREGLDTPMLTSSASIKDGVMTVTIANTSHEEAAVMSCDIRGFDAKTVKARILAGEMHAHNTFDAPETVVIHDMDAAIKDGVLNATLPACSVAEFVIK